MTTVVVFGWAKTLLGISVAIVTVNVSVDSALLSSTIGMEKHALVCSLKILKNTLSIEMKSD